MPFLVFRWNHLSTLGSNVSQSGSYAVRDHLRSNLGISSGLGIICGAIQTRCRGAFHYAKPTGQRSVGIPEENGTTFTRLDRANQ